METLTGHQPMLTGAAQNGVASCGLFPSWPPEGILFSYFLAPEKSVGLSGTREVLARKVAVSLLEKKTGCHHPEWELTTTSIEQVAGWYKD